MAGRTLVASPLLWIALSLGLLTHAAYLSLDRDHYGADTPSYLIPADNLLHGQGFVNALHQPELRRTPGYPLLLAIFRVAPLKVEYLILLQHACCVLLAVAVTAFALRVTGSRVVALTAASVLSLDLATLRIANLLLTEITSTLLITLAAWLVYRAITKPGSNVLTSVAAGLLGGCAALVRPVSILYFVPLSLCLFLARGRCALRPLVFMIASFLLLPMLWSTRNLVDGGYFGLSTIGTEDILYYRAAGALAVQQPGNYLSNVRKVRDVLIDQTCADLERAYGRNCSQVTETQTASYSVRKGMNIIRDNSLSYLRSSVWALAYIVFGGGAEALSKISNVSPRAAEYMVLLFTVPEACLAVVGCWYWYRRDRNLCYLLVFSIGYFFLISAGAEAYSRFKVPMMPLYALLIGGGAAEMLQWIQTFTTARATSENATTTLS